MLIHTFIAHDGVRERRRLVAAARRVGARTSTSTDKTRFWSRISRDSFDLVLVRPSFLTAPLADAIAALRDLPDRPDVIVVLEAGDRERRDPMLAAGVAGVLDMGCPDPELEDQLRLVVSRRQDSAAERLRFEQAEETFHLADFVSLSPAMRRLISVARRVAASDTSVLLLGETGVGKEWLARAIHEDGRRRAGPLIAVNMSAIPDTLLESELFGHVGGAFTDARRSHRGYFELAHGGTVFLDEVAELSGHLQSKLLRILQDREVRPLGAESSRLVDVRVIAATSRDLDEEMEAKRFRPDLYYRLGVVTLIIPPLRDRREDIPELVQSYFEHFQVKLRRKLSGIQPAATQKLVDYAWPGNVRELMNVIERAVLLCRGSEIGIRDLPDEVGRGRDKRSRPAPAGTPVEAGERDAGWWSRPWGDLLEDVVGPLERTYLDRMLNATGGRVGAAARRAGITPRTLYQKMKRHGLRKEDYKA